MDSSEIRMLITGITGGLGQWLENEAVKRNIQYFGQTTHIEYESDKVLRMNFADVNHLPKLKELIKKNDVNCIINNSAIYSHVEFTQLKDYEILGMINTNLTVPIILSKYLYSYLTERKKSGIIVNVNSLSGKQPTYSEAVYSATKFGLSGFGSSLSMNQKKSNIKILDCYIGGMKTKMTANRSNYETLLEPGKVACSIFDLILKPQFSNVTSIEIRN